MKIKFVSTTGHLIFCLLYKHTNRASGRAQEKKVKFHWIFWDKFTEKMDDFGGISREFSRPISMKNDR